MIGPSIKGAARETFFLAKNERLRKQLRLHLLGVTLGIEAKLRHHHGTITSNVVEPGEVVLERFRILKKEIEGREVGMERFEKLRGGKAGIGDRKSRGVLLRKKDQFVELLPDLGRSHPARDVRWNFVSDKERPQRGMITLLPKPIGQVTFCLLKNGGLRQKVTAVGPSVSGKDKEARLFCLVQKLLAWQAVSPNRIEARIADTPKLERVLQPRLLGKRPVSDTAQKVPLPIQEEVFSIDGQTRHSHKLTNHAGVTITQDYTSTSIIWQPEQVSKKE